MNDQNSLFPVGLPVDWQATPSATISTTLLDWLFDEHSLTARLKALSNEFYVEVLGERIEPCSASEATADILAGELVLVREVLLFCDRRPHVFARSLLPQRCLTGAEQKLANLGTVPLGQVLFSDPQLTRKEIQIASFDQHSSVANLARQYQLPVIEAMWGRRSTFLLNQKPLMVAEVFLPQAFAYQVESAVK